MKVFLRIRQDLIATNVAVLKTKTGLAAQLNTAIQPTIYPEIEVTTDD